MKQTLFSIVLTGLLLLMAGIDRCPAKVDEADGYRPVAPPEAIRVAIERNLSIAGDWIADKDFRSATETAQGLSALGWLYGMHCQDPSWKKQADSIKDRSLRFMAAAKKQDQAGCQKLLTEMRTTLGTMKSPDASAPPAAEKKLTVYSSTRTWMMLMEGTHVDAKMAEDAGELRNQAYALAEQTNVAIHLRSEANWQRMARDARASALESARKAEAKDFQGAKAALKQTYARCEACHQNFKR